jgi:predicted O-methyltransferase YrrM
VGLFSFKRERAGADAGASAPAAERGAAAPADVRPGEARYSQDYVSAHAPNWMEALHRLVGKPDALGLEIGAFEGRSTRWFVEKVLTGARARLIVMDPHVSARFHENVASIAPRIDYLREPSQVALRDRRWRPGSFDFIYIDGDHSARAVLEDSVLAWRLLKPGGVLIWDDYRWKAENTTDPLKSPGPAIDAFLALFAGDYDVLLSGWQIIVRRKSE